MLAKPTAHAFALSRAAPVFLLGLGVFFGAERLGAESLFSSEPLTASGEFTTGIEGPACDRDGNVYAVNFGKQGTIGRVTPDGKGEVWATLPEGSVGNGIRFDAAGVMYVADYPKHNVLRIDPSTRKVTVFAHEPRMNQPNDLAIGPDGTLWASDPNWGKGTGQVWRVERSGKVTLAAADMGTTNGVEVSPDGKALYVNESVQRVIWVFDIADGGKLVNKRALRRFEDHGFDGMRCDVFGNLYVTRYGKGTVVKLAPNGKTLREIDVLGARPSNICFGGPDGRTAYVTEVEHRRLVSFRVDAPGLAWNRWVRTRVEANLAKRLPEDGLPEIVHVFEDFETAIEKRWWLRGTEFTEGLPSSSESEPNRRCLSAVPSRDFDRRMGDRARTYRAVVFNPVPGPPMRESTRLRFRYRLERSSELRVQIFSLSRNYHRYLTLRGLPQDRWETATVDMTRARRPDGSGGPLGKDERIDDIQFYVDEKASLAIDDIVLYEPSRDPRGAFPRRVIFTGWFDTGKQGAGKEWPGEFEIVLHDMPVRGAKRGWDFARSVRVAGSAEPRLNIGLRGQRRLSKRTRLRFDYRLDRASELEVALTRTENGRRVDVATAPVPKPVVGKWTHAAVDFELEAQPSLVADRLEFRRLGEDVELRVDDLLLFEP